MGFDRENCDWYLSHVLKEIERASREWLENKINEINNTERCETTIE